MSQTELDPAGRAVIAQLHAGIDHVRGPDTSSVILEYGDYECPYSRLAFREIGRVERAMQRQVRFAWPYKWPTWNSTLERWGSIRQRPCWIPPRSPC